jgi:hypothetical protein
MQQLEHVVVPITQLKHDPTAVFDALADERRVYVAKHGRVIAAIDPFSLIPTDVLAAFSAPTKFDALFSELTARQMGRAVPSTQVAEASEGLPSLVTKDGKVYGLLRGSSAPATTGDEAARMAAMDQAVRDYLTEHPHVDRESMLAFVDNWHWDGSTSSDSLAESLELTHLDIPDTVFSPAWEDVGSEAEPVAVRLVAALRSVVDRARTVILGPVGPVPAVVTSAAESAQFDDWTLFRIALKAEIADDLADARVGYITSLLVDETPNAASLWRLGEMSRAQGHVAEAACWFDLSRATVLVDEPARRHFGSVLPFTDARLVRTAHDETGRG